MFGGKTRYVLHSIGTCFLSPVHFWMQLTVSFKEKYGDKSGEFV